MPVLGMPTTSESLQMAVFQFYESMFQSWVGVEWGHVHDIFGPVSPCGNVHMVWVVYGCA